MAMWRRLTATQRHKRVEITRKRGSTLNYCSHQYYVKNHKKPSIHQKAFKSTIGIYLPAITVRLIFTLFMLYNTFHNIFYLLLF